MKRIIYITLLALLAGCVDDFNPSLPFSEQDLLVVEGDIIEGESVIFYLSKGFSLNEEELPEGYNDVTANVYLIDSNGNKSQQAQKVDKGAYQLEIGELDMNTAYGIEIEYNNQIYRSDLEKPLIAPEIDEVIWKQPIEKEELSVYLSSSSHNPEKEYYLWTYEEVWEIMANYFVIDYWTPADDWVRDLTGSKFYCWKRNIGKEILIAEGLADNRIVDKLLYKIPVDENHFHVLYSANITQRSISKSAYEFYQSKLKMNEEMGGLFTPQPSELIGNIKCITTPSMKIIGYVGVSKSIAEKRIFIFRNEVSTPPEFGNCEMLKEDEDIFFDSHITPERFYEMGYFRLKLGSSPPEIFWTKQECADCTANGGSKNKPVFWPNDHQ